MPLVHTRFINKKSDYHPFITGYWYLHMEVPDEIKNDSSDIDHVKFLNSCAKSFEPPSRTIEKAEIVGFGGIKKFLPISQSFSNSFTISFFEFMDNPVSETFSKWTDLCINAGTGASNKKYKKDAFILIAKPTVSGQDKLADQDINEVLFFHGVFPVSDPISKFSSDIENIGPLVIDVEFNFDGFIIRKNFNLSEYVSKYNTDLGEFKPFYNTISDIFSTG